MFVPLINLVMLYFLAFARWNVVPAAMVYPCAAAGSRISRERRA